MASIALWRPRAVKQENRQRRRRRRRPNIAAKARRSRKSGRRSRSKRASRRRSRRSWPESGGGERRGRQGAHPGQPSGRGSRSCRADDFDGPDTISNRSSTCGGHPARGPRVGAELIADHLLGLTGGQPECGGQVEQWEDDREGWETIGMQLTSSPSLERACRLVPGWAQCDSILRRSRQASPDSS